LRIFPDDQTFKNEIFSVPGKDCCTSVIKTLPFFFIYQDMSPSFCSGLPSTGRTNYLYRLAREYDSGTVVHENQGVYVLVSQHFDGEIIAIILKAFGFKSIRGSSTAAEKRLLPR